MAPLHVWTSGRVEPGLREATLRDKIPGAPVPCTGCRDAGTGCDDPEDGWRCVCGLGDKHPADIITAARMVVKKHAEITGQRTCITVKVHAGR